MMGERCLLEALDAKRHGEALFSAYAENGDGSNWTYLPYGPFRSLADYRDFASGMQGLDDPIFFVIIDRATGKPVGVAAYLRIAADIGSIEVGHLNYAPALQRTPSSTEAMYLMMKRVFDDWGYRRYEWKCDSLNAPSVAAAQRLGFRFEGVFRNHVIFKRRNRDTAWFSITDGEWPGIRCALESWLDPGNFDDKGRQRKRLFELMPSSIGKAIVLDADSA